MKSNFSFVFHSCIPLSSKLTSFIDMDCLSRSVCLCFLTVKTIQVLKNKLAFWSGTNYFRLGRFSRSSQTGIFITSVESASKHNFSESGFIKETTMGKKKKAFPSETNPKKKLKVEANEGKKYFENKRQRPNYFVAVQILNPDIHEAIQRIQDHIIAQKKQFIACMNSIVTLHITLMVMNIPDIETHNRALEALRNVHEECKEEMCENPLRLEFCGLGHFNNRVLYAKIEKNKSFERLCSLAESVRKHFADFEIFSTDQREFNPHLTIAKIDFSKNKQKVLRKIEPSLYEIFLNEYVGCEKVVGIQLLSMTSPKNEAGYYAGENLVFESNVSGSSREKRLADTKEKKQDIRKKIANLAPKLFN